MLCTHEEFGGTVPYCDNNFVTCKKGLQGLVNQTSEAEIPNLDGSRGGDKYVSGLEVPVENMRGM